MTNQDTAAPAAPVAVPACCGRPMSTISVTDAVTELSLVSCSSCSRHAWLKDGALLDREGMLDAVRERLAEVPRPRGGRPKGSGKKAVPAPRVEDAGVLRAREMRGMLAGFRDLGDA